MAKHKDIYIYSTELIGEMMDAGCWDDETIAAELGWSITEEDHGPAVVDPLCWCRVSWPEHVITPSFNGDASYHSGVDDEIEPMIDIYNQVHASSLSRW